ncbi:MAG: AmmeMemoRadiSam system protein A [Acidimicrobiia bacterium]
MNVHALTPTEERELLDIGLEAIRAVLLGERFRAPAAATFTGRLAEPGASFVTLTREEELLGCIGTLSAHQPLGVDVAQHAVAAAFADPRMPAISGVEFEVMTTKVSVISPLESVPARSLPELAELLEIGRDGLLVESLAGGATFLPSVWEQLPDVDSFLGALWRKAGWRPGTTPPGLRAARYRTLEITDAGPRPLHRAA